ncbi:1-deoxy-D-xylulose-5-phosphate reductoisomerase [Roseibacillus persicicus]|uniref:1-deoxy-D-xylulose-5-phosphate reductoisomerase n=1 Tax=Roseibacillus persicicus TaxID=454148 RepID=UPI00280E6205|nr:1-deoxy-D-xylulose-5-phosphate reductoisomerase [Roseibacillus persicicus]MDQ8192227.1 1-deoxy-D-xylulose-5-phosphate reductoisomerase [Roseibacillus persicicus]
MKEFTGKRVVILGSTGSIGESALKVARELGPDQMQVVGLAAGTRHEELAAQAKEFGVRDVCIYDESRRSALEELLPGGNVSAGAEGLMELATLANADMILVSIVGTAGLLPTLAAIEAGKDLAIASKEILVMAGEIVMTAAREKGVNVLPVDSEHNAIFQCLEGQRGDSISRLILTASGGPFRTWEKEKLAHVTLAQALKHPTWSMGQKITIDSATMFNKGLEMIEARWLFGVGMEKVDVIVHPQSIVHSMVEYLDGSVLAQLSTTDMCFPIQYAVTWPARCPTGLKPLDFAELAKLEFEAAREDAFPAVRLAREAGLAGGCLPAVLNAANEVAVDAFVQGRLGFTRIAEVVESTMEKLASHQGQTLEEILAADTRARELAQKALAV